MSSVLNLAMEMIGVYMVNNPNSSNTVIAKPLNDPNSPNNPLGSDEDEKKNNPSSPYNPSSPDEEGGYVPCPPLLRQV